MFRIDTRNPTPIGEQIFRQIAFAVATGVFRPGDKLPSVRELSSKVLVNPNTVAKVYRELERSGIVQAKRGLGMFVANGSEARCARIREKAVRLSFRESATLAGQAGLKPEEARRIAREEIGAMARKAKR